MDATTTATDVTIRATELVKLFGNTRALDGVSLEARAGEVVCIIGHNGAGKTTLLNLLAGTTLPDAGEVEVFGMHRWLQNYEIRKRSITLGNSPYYGGASSAFEHLSVIGQLYGIPEPEFDAKVARFAEDIELAPHLLKKWQSMSSGMMRKVGLIGAFLPDVKLRIFDEPFASGIDPAGVETLFRWFAEARSRGETIIFTTQILDQAEEIADRIVLLRKGKVRASGSPAEFLAQAGVTESEARPLAKAYAALNTDPTES